MPNPKLYLIDVSGLCYRAYYAIPGLATSYGQPTGAVFGFTNILNKILKNNPEYVACCFDVSRQTFRKEKFAGYKIQRPPTPEGLVSQMPLVKETVAAYNIAMFELEGYEADDLIASLAKKAKRINLDILIISSDKDILQLVSKGVSVLDPKKDKAGLVYDEKQVELRYGLKPKMVVDMLSLMGDAADNIPGVPGIGEKTATSLLQEFGSIDSLIENIRKIKSESLRKAIEHNSENIRKSYELVLLKDDLEIVFDIDKLKRREPDYDRLFPLFKKLEFNSFIKGLPDRPSSAPEVTFDVLKDSGKIDEALSSVKKKKELFLVLDKENNRVCFSCGDGIYIVGCDDLLLADVLREATIKKVGHNLKEIEMFFFKRDLSVEGLYFDTMLAAYLLDSSMPNFSLEDLAFKYLEERHSGLALSPETSLYIIMRLWSVLQVKLKKDSLEKLFYDLEMPLVNVLAIMQNNGVCIDTGILKSLSGEFEKRLIELRDDIYSLNSNQEFNLNSPKQLAVVLFERLKLPIIKKTKTGLSTDEEVLRRLSTRHRLPLMLLEYRQLTKLKNTYIDSLPALIDHQTHRVHATFDQVGTETGRLSSSSPNLQNIPIKSDVASLIRKAFIAPKGKKIFSADYSQIELRVMAHFSKDKALISAFNSDLDIHLHTASLIFGVAENLVSDAMRETAKRINFGIIYGMSSFGLAKDLEIAPEEAKGFIDAYFLRYPGVKEFIDRQIKSSRETGYATTLLGRRRLLSGINSNNNSLRSFAERQAVNSTIQGSAADLIKLAMINIHEVLRSRRLRTMMIMQIHDELVFEVPHEESGEVLDLFKGKMETVYELLVPIRVNIKSGNNWLEMQPVVG